MKKIFMLLVVAMATVFFTSCSKDDETEPIISEEGIITMTQDVRGGYAWFDVYAAKAGVVITIDWGDGNIEKFKTVKEERDGGVWYTFRAKHTHSQSSIHTIKMTGALIGLGCNGDNLTSLDVSKCTALEVLDCKENQLTSLDVSKCTALTELSCGRNRLTSLDVSKCTALTWLSCKENQLTSLDVSKCTALTSLLCNGDNLTSLDISKCTALEVLDCKENQLTSLDVSKCTALERLDCYYNKFSANTLNKIFTDLPQGKTWQEDDYTQQSSVHIEGNPGTATCNKSIAENKGWKVRVN